MVKVSGSLDSTFWTTQRKNAFRMINTAAGNVVGFTTRKAQRSQRKRLRYTSDFQDSAVEWANLDEPTKEDWIALGAEYGLTGWQAFLQRATLQAQLGATRYGVLPVGQAYFGGGSEIDNYGTNAIANYRMGTLYIASDTISATLEQDHPQNYNIRRRIPLSKRVFETVAVNEVVLLPLTIGISWRMITDSDYENIAARFYARIEYETEEGTDYLEQGFDFEPSNEWQRDTLEIAEAPGTILGYALFIDVAGMEGRFEFDNILAYHTATNWAIDATCDNVNPTYLPQWGDINKTWQVSSTGGDVFLESRYINDLTLE